MFFMRSKVIATGLILALAVPSVNVVEQARASAETPIVPIAQSGLLDPSQAVEAREMESGLAYIVSIPDEVLAQGDHAVSKWMEANPSALYPTGNGAVISIYASVAGCTAAILGVTAGNLVGAAKLLKIKKYINALGGVGEAVRLMWGASFSYEKMAAVGGALGALAGELTGITAVRNECFN